MPDSLLTGEAAHARLSEAFDEDAPECHIETPPDPALATAIEDTVRMFAR